MAPHSSTLAWKILWMEEPGIRTHISNVVTTTDVPLMSEDSESTLGYLTLWAWKISLYNT